MEVSQKILRPTVPNKLPQKQPLANRFTTNNSIMYLWRELQMELRNNFSHSLIYSNSSSIFMWRDIDKILKYSV